MACVRRGFLEAVTEQAVVMGECDRCRRVRTPIP